MNRKFKLITNIIAGVTSLVGLFIAINSAGETYNDRRMYYGLFIISLCLAAYTITLIFTSIDEYHNEEVIVDEVVKELEPMSDFDKCYLIALKTKKGKHEE